MSEFGGLWKHKNNPACTKNDSNVKLCGWWSLTEEEKEEEEEEEEDTFLGKKLCQQYKHFTVDFKKKK